MEILGLERDYYLAGNDIFIKVLNTTLPSLYLDVDITNETTGETLGTLRPYPNAAGEYRFNVCMPVRALLPEPWDIDNPNSLHRIAIRFKATLNNQLTEQATITKYFVRGGRDKKGAAQWNLNTGDPLLIGDFPHFVGIAQPPHGAHRLQGGAIVEYMPTNVRQVYLKDRCNPTYIKFLNSLGGYQWWVFEQRIDNVEGKAGKTKTSPTFRLREDSTRQLVTTKSREVTLQSDVPIEFYDVMVDLITSNDIYIFNPQYEDYDSKYERVFLRGTNKVEKNTVARRIEMELNLFLPDYVTREL